MDSGQNMKSGLIIGIDITKYDIQVSCLPLHEAQAETISTQMGSDQYEIPLCLFKKEESSNWHYGNKARQYMYSKQGMYVEDLWEGMLGNREMILEDETISYKQLMTIFLEKILLLVTQNGYSQEIEAFVFTTEDMNDNKIRCLNSVIENMKLTCKNVFYLDYKECFGAYAVNGSKDLWNHDVFLFYYAGRTMKAFQLRVNQKTLPFKMLIGETDFGELEYGKEELEDSQSAREEMDNRFEATIEEVFARKIVSAVYLIGDGFLSGWMKNSLRALCRGRRVFQGNNLFTKGACYAGRWYLGVQKPAGEYESKQMLPCEVRIPVDKSDGSKGYIYGGRRGDLWYRAECETECMVELLQESQENESDQYEVKVELAAVLSNGEMAVRTIDLELENFPKRPRKASRVKIRIDFLNEHTGRIVVTDMGFGEFYPTSGLCWEKQFALDVAGLSEKEGTTR